MLGTPAAAASTCTIPAGSKRVGTTRHVARAESCASSRRGPGSAVRRKP
ncbi:hypothetical protein PGAAJM_06065 [Kocuria varians]